jgi:Tannase-like family of unknown function (DUF6351)
MISATSLVLARRVATIIVAFSMIVVCSVPNALADNGLHRGQFEINVLSSQPYLVSGGSALVEVDVPRQVATSKVHVFANGIDVTSAFHADAGAGTLTGLVTGLRVGDNVVQATPEPGRHSASAELHLTNYPITGPMISGPHIEPFICQTETFKLPDGTTLGPPLDSDCSAPTKVNYVYMSTAGGAFKPLLSTSNLPADVVMTTTSAGVTVPFVVRVETGTLNRGIYQNSILFDPTRDPPPTPFSAPKGWNKRLIGVHGSGCPGGWYIQGPAEGASVLDASRLGEGYAMFTNTLNHPTNSCNPFLAGETTIMNKEHFIKTFGVPEFSVSTGGSGGAYTSLEVADEFPGVFQGVLINATFPDAQAIALSGLDGHLLTNYFLTTNPTSFTAAQQLGVTGYKDLQAWYDAANQMGRTDPVPGRTDPTPGNPILGPYTSAVWNPAVPVSLRYDPVTNPQGARPTIFDVSRNIYGVDPVTGFALRAFDNVGVQYGLAALNAGLITKSQFLDLNKRIGGYDHDANFVPQRTVGDVGAIRRAAIADVTLGGGGGLASIPVFDTSGLFDETQLYHYQWFHFAARQRMIEANGNARNHVMWRGGLAIGELLGTPTPAGAALSAAVNNNSWSKFIEWVAAVASDNSHASQRVKVILNRPADLVDGCWTYSTDPKFIAEPQTFSSLPNSQCNTLWPSYSNPRKEAGGPLAANTLKCKLRPVHAKDYAVSFTQGELAELRAIFPDGVCDWSKPGVGSHPVVPWSSFGPSPVNQQFDVTTGRMFSQRYDHDHDEDYDHGLHGHE